MKKKTFIDYKDFIKQIEKAYLSTRKNEEYKKKKTFSPSLLGYSHGTCPRFWYLAFNGAVWKEENTAKGIANMENGSQAHERLQAMIEKTVYHKTTEKEIISEDPPIKGFADVVLQKENDEVVGEIKTIKEQYYINKEITLTPADNHLLQILIYMKVLKAKEGFVLYENKNTQDILILPVHMTKEHKQYLNYVWGWLKEVYKSYSLNTIPKIPFRKNSKICNKCPLYETCRSEDEGFIDIKALEVSVEKVH